MPTLDKFNVPIDKSGKTSLMIMPLARYRFRLANCSPLITNNVKDVEINFSKNHVIINLRATIEAASFHAALLLANNPMFTIEPMGSGDQPCFSIIPSGLRLVDHSFILDYAHSEPAIHGLVFSYRDLTIIDPITDSKVPYVTEPGFKTPAEVAEELEKNVTARTKPNTTSDDS